MHDVIVIGGGPSGSTAANLLAAHGRKVLLLEREVFPRFHIGESLLPCDLPIFKRLGVELKATCQFKKGAEFIDEKTGDVATFDFNAALAGENRTAWQVERSVFDKLLLDRAAAVGAEVRQGVKVASAAFDEGGVTVSSTAGEFRARYAIDATGQDALFARNAHTVEPWDGFGRAAVFTHYTGLSEEIWSREILPNGNIKILMVDDGWMWVIPLRGPKLSVGIVTRGGRITSELLDEAIAASPIIQKLTAGSERTPAKIIRNFSYKNHRTRGPRFLCVGDAAAFLDPVFSTGVSLGMLSSELAADVLAPALASGREGDAELMAAHEAKMAIAYQQFGALVHFFYNRKLVHNLFFGEDARPDIRAGITSILAGDVWRTDNKFADMLTGSSRAADATPFTRRMPQA